MNVFYNIVSILIGIIILVFSIITYVKKKKLLFLILSVIHSVLFVGFGILGFILMGTEYEYITILSMLAFCITYLIVLLVVYKKEPKENKDNK
jgi:Ca2+/Na+ antiporter